MTCADARHRILAADISALRGESDRLLCAHLDGGPACAADASTVVRETSRLGVALATRARQPEIRRASRRRSAFILAPIGVAAAITLVVTHRIAPARPDATRLVVPRSSPALTSSVSDGDTDLVSPPRSGAKQISSRVATAFPTPVAESNVFVDQPMPEVGVTVGDNQRAAIIATSNPKITFIWLSRGQQP
jgi:hypothetical protein